MANKLPANKNSKLSSYEGLSSLPNLAQIPEEVLGREVAAYNEHINNVLKAHAADLAPYLPLPLAEADSLVLFERVRDGVVLGHLIHELNASKISLKKLNLKIDLSTVGQNNSKALFEVNSNLDLVIQAAKDYGIVVVNIGAEDILHSHRDLVLGLVWQLVRAHLVAAVNLATHPELIRLLEKNETLPELMSLPADQILLRWFNYHLRRAGHATEIKNLSKDIADSEAYTVLMKQIAPKLVDQSKVDAVRALPKSEAEARAKLMLEIADALGCRKFVTYKDVAAGHSRLNFAFTATLFNKYIGIRLPTEEEIAAIYDELDALREKVKELTQNKRDNEAKIGLLESAIKALEDKLGVVEREKQLLKVDIEKLNRSLADETSRFEETIEAANKKHSAFRDAQAKELAAVRDLLTSHFGSDAAACPAGTTGEGDELNSQLRWFVSRLIEENLRQAKQIQDLQADKERNAKMNQIIDAKIVAVSEELIEYKKKAEKKK